MPGDVSARQFADFFAEAAQNARLGLAHRDGAHFQLGGDVAGRLILDGGAPKGLPGAWLEFGVQHLQGAMIQRVQLVRRRLRQRRIGPGHLLHLLQCVGAAERDRAAPLTAEEVEQLVAGNAVQPAAEGRARLVASVGRQTGGNRLENLLADIVGVGAAHAPVVAPVAD